MSSESHKNARKMLSINTLVFGISSLYFVYIVVNLLRELVMKQTLMTGTGIFGMLVLVGFVFISLRHYRKAWKAFSNLDYRASVLSGVISWAYPVGMILLTLIMSR